MHNVNWKKIHSLNVKSYVLFGNLTEDYSLGDSLSDSSEELFQRDKRGASYNKSFNRHLKLMILVFFCVWEDASVWTH